MHKLIELYVITSDNNKYIKNVVPFFIKLLKRDQKCSTDI